MAGEVVGIERIERFYILEKLIELGVDFKPLTAVLVERIREPVEREDKAFRPLSEQIVRRPLLDEFPVQRRQPGEHRSGGALVPIGRRGAARKRVRRALHLREVWRARTAWRLADWRHDASSGCRGRAEPGQSIPAGHGQRVILGIVYERPTHFAQGHGLPGDPLAQSTPRFLVNPMLRLSDGLAVQLEKQIGMTSLQNLRGKVLVTSDAGVGAHINVAQIAHAGSHPRVVAPVRSRMPAQPAPSSAMAAFAGNAFVRVRRPREPAGRDRLKRGMAGGAACARLGRPYSEPFGNSLGSRIEQNGVRLGMKIFLDPGDVLAAFWTGAAVATG